MMRRKPPSVYVAYRWVCAISVVSVALGWAKFTAQVSQAQPDQAPAPQTAAKAPKLSLEIAPLLEDESRMTEFAFTVTNLGQEDVRAYGPTMGDSDIIVLTPSHESHVLLSGRDGVALTLKPKLSIRWRVSVADLNYYMRDLPKTPGTWRMYWKVGDQKSAEVPFLRG